MQIGGNRHCHIERRGQRHACLKCQLKERGEEGFWLEGSSLPPLGWGVDVSTNRIKLICIHPSAGIKISQQFQESFGPLVLKVEDPPFFFRARFSYPDIFWTSSIGMNQHSQGPFGTLVLMFCGSLTHFEGNWPEGPPYFDSCLSVSTQKLTNWALCTTFQAQYMQFQVGDDISVISPSLCVCVCASTFCNFHAYTLCWLSLHKRLIQHPVKDYRGQ